MAIESFEMTAYIEVCGGYTRRIASSSKFAEPDFLISEALRISSP